MYSNQKIFFLLALISLICTVLLINNTYAKYKTDADANTNISIAKWNILINNQDIKTNHDFSNTISPVFSGNENIASGIIAPTAEGYFDIIINCSNVDVSFSSNLKISVSEDSNVPDLLITGYTINDGELLTFNNGDYELNDTTLYTDTTRVKHYRFYVKWEDGIDATMDNAADTAATSNGMAKFNINVSFIQLAN